MIEHHPYGTFIPKRPKAMIVGSFPIGKFTDPYRRQEIRAHEFDFFFGGEKNLLWKLLAEAFNRPLKTKTDILKLLEDKGLAIGDVIKSCKRKEGKAGDKDLYEICWNHDLLDIIESHGIKKIYFTSKQVQRWFHSLFPEAQLDEILLISPSGQSVRSVVKMKEFLIWKKKHPKAKPMDFIRDSYKRIFRRI